MWTFTPSWLGLQSDSGAKNCTHRRDISSSILLDRGQRQHRYIFDGKVDMFDEHVDILGEQVDILHEQVDILEIFENCRK